MVVMQCFQTGAIGGYTSLTSAHSSYLHCYMKLNSGFNNKKIDKGEVEWNNNFSESVHLFVFSERI